MYNYNLNGITVTTFLDNRRQNISGKYPIKIRVTCKRKRKYYATGKELELDAWEKLPKAKNSAMIELRDDLQLSFEKVKDAVLYLEENEGFSFDALNTYLGKGTSSTLTGCFTLKIERLKEEDRVGTMSFYQCALNKVIDFRGENIELDSVNVDWLKKFEKHMLDQNCTYTTIGMYGRAIRSVINEAIKDGVMRANQYPFGKGKYEIPQGEGRKMALTLKQIKDVVSYSDGSEATECYRDLWFFSYLCNGINMIDMLQLQFKDIENDEVSFYRSKTIRTSKKKSKIQVVVTTEMKKIIKKWGNKSKTPNDFIFPYLKGGESAQDIKRIVSDVTKRINLRMKTISEELELPRISTYTARHSFATVLKRSGANIAYISESLGHNDLKTTENYLASFEREEREKNAKLLTNFDDL